MRTDSSAGANGLNGWPNGLVGLIPGWAPGRLVARLHGQAGRLAGWLADELVGRGTQINFEMYMFVCIILTKRAHKCTKRGGPP